MSRARCQSSKLENHDHGLLRVHGHRFARHAAPGQGLQRDGRVEHCVHGRCGPLKGGGVQCLFASDIFGVIASAGSEHADESKGCETLQVCHGAGDWNEEEGTFRRRGRLRGTSDNLTLGGVSQGVGVGTP